MRVAAVSTCVCAVAASSARAEPFATRGGAWDSLTELVTIAEQELGEQVEQGDTLDYGALSPADALWLVHPTSSLEVAAISRFLHAGGRVVLLDDYGGGDRLLEHFGMRRVPLGEASQSVGGHPEWALARPSGLHQTIAGLDQVVLNHATALTHPNLSTVLEVELRSGEKRVVAVAGAVGRGRLFVVSDASLFIDSMLQFPQNRQFAEALLRYSLEADSWGERGGKIWLRSERFTQRGGGEVENALREGLQRARERLREALRSLDEQGLGGLPAWLIGLAVAAFCARWALRHARKPHLGGVPSFARPWPAVVLGGLPGKIEALKARTTRRAQTLAEYKNVFEQELIEALRLPRERAWSAEQLALEGQRAGWQPARLAELREVLFRMARAETSLLSRGSMKDLSEQEVVGLISRAESLLEAVRGVERLEVGAE